MIHSPARHLSIALSTALLLLTGCGEKSARTETAVPVQVAAVKQAAIQRVVTAEAILFPVQQSAIAPKISAPVRTFLVKRGSRVHAGELLAVLEHRDLEAAAQESKGAYDQAQAAFATTTAASLPEELRKAELDRNAARQTLDAQEKVYQSRQDLFQQGALPRKELDQALVEVTQARNQYEIAQKHFDALLAVGKQQTLKSAAGQLESAKGKFRGAEAELSYSEIRSPLDGVVSDRPLYPGEMATAGTPLLTVMDISQVIARGHIPQPEAERLKVGDAAAITIPGEDTAVEGHISVISPALDPNSTTVEVWVQAVNPQQRLKPGTSVQVSMAAETVPGALVVPVASLLTASDGSTSVMVAGTDHRAHARSVHVGIRSGEQVQIVSGVAAGEIVVTAGSYGLPDNARIQVEESHAK